MTGTPINPQAIPSSIFLNFGTQTANTTSAPMSVTLKNTGTTPLSLTKISTSGSFALASGTTCMNGGTVHPSGTCTIYVTFTPKSTGPAHGAVIITDNALFSRQIIGLSGIGK
jgi:hypothetical protein